MGSVGSSCGFGRRAGQAVSGLLTRGYERQPAPARLLKRDTKADLRRYRRVIRVAAMGQLGS
jgi:hypothetical protein